MIVLVIDERQVAAPVKYEPPPQTAGEGRPPQTAGEGGWQAAPVGGREADHAGSILFPHIYGPINREAIVGVVAARRGPDGEFLGFEGALDAGEEAA